MAGLWIVGRAACPGAARTLQGINRPYPTTIMAIKKKTAKKPTVPPPADTPHEQLTGGQKIRQRAAENTAPLSEADKVIAGKGRKPGDDEDDED